MKNLIKTFAILPIFILLTNCEKENTLNESSPTNINVKESTLKTVSLSDLKTDLTFKKLSDHYLPNLIQDLDETNYLKSSTNDFIITSDTINVVEKENYKSYTIRIKRNTESSYTVENLVLEQRDSLQKAFIFSYEFEPEWIVEFLGDKKTPPKGKVSIEEYDINNLKSSYQKSGFCAWVDIWITFPCGCGHYSRPPCKGSTCGGRFWPQKEIHSVYYCDSTGDGFFDLAGGGGTGGGGSGGGGGFGGSSADSSETGMVMEDTTELMLYGVMVDLANSLGLNPVQRDWVLDPANYIVGLQLNDFLSDNEDSQEAKDFIVDFLDITDKIPNAKFERYLELIDLIEDDPFVLLEDCVQENGLAIANYQQLYDHTLPTSCTDRLNALGTGFQDQPLNTGNAAVANVDYYSVEITANPDFNLDGNPDTDAEVFNAYRANFTSWASGSKDDFQFSCDVPFDSDNRADVSWTFSPYYSSDATIWNSSNPLTAIIRIDANSSVSFGNLISDDGAIMISDFTSQFWIGSTVQTLQTGTQPFSGNRQWGFSTNQNGNLELYTRAVDVARISDIVLFGPGDDECKEDTYYNIGEATWSNLQEQIKQWININGGQATIVPKTAIRFDKTKLKQQLESNTAIDEINCN